MQTLETPQLLLRGLQENDYLELHKAFWNDPDIMGEYTCKSAMEVKDLCTEIEKRVGLGEEYFWLICDARKKSIFGAIAIKDFSKENYSAQAVFCVEKAYQNKSIASDALSIVLCYVFTATDINKLNIKITADNLKAKKIALKCGFTKDGILKQEIKVKNSFLDAEVYSMTKNMFEEYLKYNG